MDFMYDFRQAQKDRLEDAGVVTYGNNHNSQSSIKNSMLIKKVRRIVSLIINLFIW